MALIVAPMPPPKIADMPGGFFWMRPWLLLSPDEFEALKQGALPQQRLAAMVACIDAARERLWQMPAESPPGLN
jgi:hypothetical protein